MGLGLQEPQLSPSRRGKVTIKSTEEVSPSGPSTDTLQLTDLTASRGSRTLFQGVSATWAPGRVNVLLGANGAGKSTLLRCILGQERFTGSVRYGGLPLPVGGSTVHVAFEDSPAHRQLTGQQNLTLLSQWRKGDPSAYLSQELLRRKVKRYSYGELKKLTLTAAMASTAPVLILDEPTNGLDQDSLEVLAMDVRRAAADRLVVVVGHDLSFLEPLAQEVYALIDGKLVHASPHSSRSDAPSLAELYTDVRAAVAR